MSFVVWVTGLPSSGKSTLAAALVQALAARGPPPEVLESDTVRRVLTPRPAYDDAERDVFYGALAWLAARFVRHGVPVIVDATAHRRRWREAAREAVPRFLEVFVDTPVEVCRRRDPKGLWRAADAGDLTTLPGAGVPYEVPERPDMHVHADREAPEEAARRAVAELEARGWLPTRR